LLFVNRVVVVSKIPVIDERRHHPQAAEFAGSHEGVSMPAPKSDLLFALHVSFQSHLPDGTARGNQILAALESWHIPHAQYRQKIIFMKQRPFLKTPGHSADYAITSGTFSSPQISYSLNAVIAI
jgi:hypothetical protein